MLLIHSSLEDTTGWRVFNGGDPLDVNAWPTHGVLNGVRGAQLVTGPRGVFLLHRNGSNGQKLLDLPPASIRSFDTKRLRWRAARGALADDQVFAQSDLSEDASGRLHIVASNADYGGLGCVMYARTSTKSSSWFGRTTILYFTRSKSRMPSGATAVAAPDGRGFATWTDTSGRAWAMPLKQAKGKYHPIRKGPNRPTCGALGTNVNCSGEGGGESEPRPSPASPVNRALSACPRGAPRRDTDSHGPRRQKARSHARRSPREGGCEGGASRLSGLTGQT